MKNLIFLFKILNNYNKTKTKMGQKYSSQKGN